MNQAPLGGFYTTAGSIGGGTTVVVGHHSPTVIVDGNNGGRGGQQSREYSPQQINLPQNFVVVSQQSGTCACTNGYAMNCDSPKCVNKFQLTVTFF